PAAAGPRSATSKAQAFRAAKASGGLIGPSTAISTTGFDGKLLKGADEVVGYDLHIGPVLVKQMHSVLNYETDGSQAGTKATWKLEFSGVGGDNSQVYTITPDGFTPQGGSAQPGSAGMKQFSDGAKAFADALEKYADPPANQKEIGPAHFPDPTPGGYGGPKSTTPVPGPAAAPAGTVSKLVRAVRPAATPVASTSPIVAARPFTVPWARDVS